MTKIFYIVYLHLNQFENFPFQTNKINHGTKKLRVLLEN